MRCLFAKAFEPALRVVHAPEYKDPRHSIEDLTHRLAQQILMHLHVRFGQCARAKHQIGPVFQGLDHFFDLFYRRGKIGVAKQDKIALSLHHPAANGVPLALILGTGENLAMDPLRFFLDHQRGAIGAPVVRHDQLKRQRSSGQILSDTPDSTSDALGLIVGGDNDRN